MEVFCGFCLFCLVRLVVFLLLLVGFYMCGWVLYMWVGVLLFSTICGGFCFGFVFPLLLFLPKIQTAKKSLNSIQSRD